MLANDNRKIAVAEFPVSYAGTDAMGTAHQAIYPGNLWPIPRY